MRKTNPDDNLPLCAAVPRTTQDTIGSSRFARRHDKPIGPVIAPIRGRNPRRQAILDKRAIKLMEGVTL